MRDCEDAEFAYIKSLDPKIFHADRYLAGVSVGFSWMTRGNLASFSRGGLELSNGARL